MKRLREQEQNILLEQGRLPTLTAPQSLKSYQETGKKSQMKLPEIKPTIEMIPVAQPVDVGERRIIVAPVVPPGKPKKSKTKKSELVGFQRTAYLQKKQQKQAKQAIGIERVDKLREDRERIERAQKRMSESYPEEKPVTKRAKAAPPITIREITPKEKYFLQSTGRYWNRPRQTSIVKKKTQTEKKKKKVPRRIGRYH
jgi:hypothetical protein